MSRPISLGYLTPERADIHASDWLVTPGHHTSVSLPTEIQNWQYSTDLLVERIVSVDLGRTREHVGLGRRDGLRCVITWNATSTGLQGASPPRQLRDGSNHVEVLVPGAAVGGTLKLRTVVTADLDPTENRERLAPHRPGSVLWSDDWQVDLEGDASRFPTEVLGFRATGIASESVAWLLQVDTADLDAPALSSVRLILNSDHPVYARLTAEPDGVEAVLTRQYLAYDVARQLVVAALAQEDLKDTEYERGSVGAVLRARLSDYFGEEGRRVEPLRQRWRSAPSEVDADLQSLFPL